jgi:peroxiredoxin family protein
MFGFNKPKDSQPPISSDPIPAEGHKEQSAPIDPRANRMSIMLYSGTVDKLTNAAILASGAAMMGMDVEIFLTFYGLLAFKKGASLENHIPDPAYPEMGQFAVQRMTKTHMPNWLDTIRDARDIGNITITACAMSVELFELKKEDLEDVVDDIIGIGGFVNRASEGKMTFYI